MADKHYKIKVTEKVFNAVKILAKGGASIKEIADFMNISDSTVSYIKKAETFEEYRNMIYEQSGYYRKKMAAIKAKEDEEKKRIKEAKQEQVKQVADKVGAVPASEMVKTPLPAAESRQTIVVQASHYMLEEQKETNRLLTAISNKLAFIVDELTK